MGAASPALVRIGSISLFDLAVICQQQGLEYLPHPFFTRVWPWKNIENDELVREGRSSHDLAEFHSWITAYANADIWLECQVHHFLASTPPIRIMACRESNSGFLASQRSDEDIIDVFSVPPLELGPAVAASVGLTAPGTHDRIQPPPFFVDLRPAEAPCEEREDEDYQISFSPIMRQRSSTRTVPRSDVTAMGVVQSRCTPARKWGLDPKKKAVGWVRIAGDGDYIYAPDFSHATPTTLQGLSARINRLIAGDIPADQA